MILSISAFNHRGHSPRSPKAPTQRFGGWDCESEITFSSLSAITFEVFQSFRFREPYERRRAWLLLVRFLAKSTSKTMMLLMFGGCSFIDRKMRQQSDFKHNKTEISYGLISNPLKPHFYPFFGVPCFSLVRSQPGHSSPRGSAGENPGHGKVPQMHRGLYFLICFDCWVFVVLPFTSIHTILIWFYMVLLWLIFAV